MYPGQAAVEIEVGGDVLSDGMRWQIEFVGDDVVALPTKQAGFDLPSWRAALFVELVRLALVNGRCCGRRCRKLVAGLDV